MPVSKAVFPACMRELSVLSFFTFSIRKDENAL